MGDDRRPFRYTRRSLSIETRGRWVYLAMFLRFVTWGLRRLKPVAYHPIALAGITVTVILCVVSPWLIVALILATPAVVREWPDTYLRHVHPRCMSFLAGFRYRYRPRRKLTANGLLNDKDPLPTISWVQKIGCTTKVRIKMSDGDEIDYWRERSARLAQTYNALDCKINPYRRKELNPFSKKLVTKPRWLELEFLTRDPFDKGMGAEFIDFHRTNTLSPILSVNRSGGTHTHNLAAHRLRIAMTRWGKSNAIRAMVYAQKHNIDTGLLELWGIDGKGGVEQSFLQHVFARVAYGDTPTNPNSYNPAQFDQLLKDACEVLKRRQRRMRGFVTEHIPTPADPWLLIVIDELLVLTSKAIPGELRNSIAASIMLIQQQGIACGVSLDASTQLAQKEKLEFRDGFTEFEVGKVERGTVDMIFGTGWWERGARADEIPDDLKGVFYKKTDTTMAPEQIRYPNIPIAAVHRDALGFQVDKSALWPLPKPVMPAGMPLGGDPPELEGEPAMSSGRLTDL